MPPAPPVDEESEAAARAALQRTLDQLLQVLDGLKDLRSAVDQQFGLEDSRPDAKIIPFPRSPKKN